MASLYRKRIVLSGRVQGVGFRFYTIRLSEAFDVGGYVRNLPDGSVEIVAEGSRDQVDSFLERASKGPSSARVTEIKSYEEPAGGQFNSFGVSY